MSYLDRWGITITKVSDGIYDVSRNDRSGRVRIDYSFTNETLNEAAALFRAIERIDPELSPLWEFRRQYAIARWKVAAYAEIIQELQIIIQNTRVRDRPPLVAQRDLLIAKRNVWVAEEERLRLLNTSDT